MRKTFYLSVAGLTILYTLSYFFFPLFLYSLVLTLPLVTLGIVDCCQEAHTIRRNYPILGNFRYLFESIRPEINQYFVESDTNGTPLNREERTLIYQRSKKVRDTIPFGTKKNTYEAGYEWVEHSINCKHLEPREMRVTVGGKDCLQPYSASILNISAMSYGSLSSHAVMALNKGAKEGQFAHNTGEGGISPHHREYNGDLIWQIGTGYFGCRNSKGGFDEELFAERASADQIKMIEIKISQGAKPGHGGILPKSKITPEIVAIRNVPSDQDVISPPSHSEFTTPLELMDFIARLRERSKGKPIGFKLCIGKRSEFISICKAMLETGIKPDFITIDGGEGGTGAAPVEFSNSIGSPLYDALVFVDNTLRGFNLKNDIKVIAAGKLTSAFGMIKRIAIGADILYSARAFMLSLGCIQALKCNSNTCPAGIATQDSGLVKGLSVEKKYKRVYYFHSEMLRAFSELLGAMGLDSPDELTPSMIQYRIRYNEVQNYAELFRFIEEGSLLDKRIHPSFRKLVDQASTHTF